MIERFGEHPHILANVTYLKYYAMCNDLVNGLKSKGINSYHCYVFGYSRDKKYIYTITHGGQYSITLGIFKNV